MMLRLAKTVLVFGIALYITLIALNNLTDYDSNYQFVRHVLMMDSTFPENHGMWRAINSPAIHTVFYWVIIVWECLTSIACWWGGVRLAKAVRKSAGEFQRAKDVAVAGLTFNLLLCGLSLDWRGVVPDVAIENRERTGSSLPDVCHPGDRPAFCSSSRR